jgi:hypothetical protein
MLTGQHRQDVFARDPLEIFAFEQHADFFQLDLGVIEKKFGGEDDFTCAQPAQCLFDD